MTPYSVKTLITMTNNNGLKDDSLMMINCHRKRIWQFPFDWNSSFATHFSSILGHPFNQKLFQDQQTLLKLSVFSSELSVRLIWINTASTVSFLGIKHGASSLFSQHKSVLYLVKIHQLTQRSIQNFFNLFVCLLNLLLSFELITVIDYTNLQI